MNKRDPGFVGLEEVFVLGFSSLATSSELTSVVREIELISFSVVIEAIDFS